MMNHFDLMGHIQKTGKPITVQEYAELMLSQGKCSSPESCVENIRQYMRSGVTAPTENGCSDCNKSRGLGDTISKITHALHIPECGGCRQRRDLLNKLVPYE